MEEVTEAIMMTTTTVADMVAEACTAVGTGEVEACTVGTEEGLMVEDTVDMMTCTGKVDPSLPGEPFVPLI